MYNILFIHKRLVFSSTRVEKKKIIDCKNLKFMPKEQFLVMIVNELLLVAVENNEHKQGNEKIIFSLG